MNRPTDEQKAEIKRIENLYAVCSRDAIHEEFRPLPRFTVWENFDESSACTLWEDSEEAYRFATERAGGPGGLLAKMDANLMHVGTVSTSRALQIWWNGDYEVVPAKRELLCG